MMSTFDKPCGSTSWYLVQCRVGKEYFTANILRKIVNVFVYLPESQIYSHGEVRLIPFFPGYFFISDDMQKVSRHAINSSPGVLRLVGFDGDPQPIPHFVIEMIAERIEELKELKYQFSHDLRRGDKVRMKEGPLQELEMVFLQPMSTRNRVYVLLEFMGRLKKISVDVGVLEKVSNKSNIQQNSNVHSMRFTRGKGRKIKQPVEQCPLRERSNTYEDHDN